MYILAIEQFSTVQCSAVQCSTIFSALHCTVLHCKPYMLDPVLGQHVVHNSTNDAGIDHGGDSE